MGYPLPFPGCFEQGDSMRSSVEHRFLFRCMSTLRVQPGIDDFESSSLEIPHVARDQDGFAGTGYGGNLAVGFADRPACEARFRRDVGIGAGGGAVERKNAFGKAEVEPPRPWQPPACPVACRAS